MGIVEDITHNFDTKVQVPIRFLSTTYVLYDFLRPSRTSY